MHRIIRCAVLLAICSTAYASSGDRNPVFQECVTRCSQTPSNLPLALRFLAWTPAADCAYKCSHAYTDAIPAGGTFEQFHGKWVFYRLAGIQEPASVVFSLLNLLVHVRGLKLLQRRVSRSNMLRPWVLLLPWIQINTWIWSTVFHTRDTPATEKLDYYSAVLTIGATLFYSIVRLFHLYTPQRRLHCIAATTLFLMILAAHYTYLLSFPAGRFPYGYNVAFSLVLGVSHNLLWAGYSLSYRLQAGPTPKQSQWPLYLVLATTASMSLELFDFAPFWRVVDAHSLWHAATVPIALGWYRFIVWDVAEAERQRLA